MWYIVNNAAISGLSALLYQSQLTKYLTLSFQYFRARQRDDKKSFALTITFQKEPRHYIVEQHDDKLGIPDGPKFDCLIMVSVKCVSFSVSYGVSFELFCENIYTPVHNFNYCRTVIFAHVLISPSSRNRGWANLRNGQININELQQNTSYSMKSCVQRSRDQC